MTRMPKSVKFNYPASVLLNLCIYLFISSVIYYLCSLNIKLPKIVLLCSSFILVFYLSSRKMDILLPKMKLKNIVILSKFFLGIITLTTAILIYNNFSLTSSYLNLLILTTAILYAILNRAYNLHYKKINSKKESTRNSELISQFNLEKLLIIILAAATAVFVKLNLIPLILLGTAVYYFISAYINTFQKI